VLRSLFDFVEGVQCWIKDREGVYRWVNRAFWLNYSVDGVSCSIVGKSDYDLSPKHLADQFRMDDERVLGGESIFGRLELVGRFDHVSSWCTTTKLPIRDVSGTITGTAGITRLADPSSIAGHADVGLARVCAYVRDHHAEAPTNTTLAKIAGRSVRALERSFVRELHLTPQQYLRRIRIRLSCQDLVYSPRPLIEIALQHGFCDQSHFSREFRLETGMTPKAYRQLYHRAPPPL
jgi:AraC-like DNA-binding protein